MKAAEERGKLRAAWEFEFRVKLAAGKPGMLVDLNRFRSSFIGRASGGVRSRRRTKSFFLGAIEIVAVRCAR